MNSYAVLFYQDEGIYSYMSLGNNMTLEEAKDAALEYIASGHTYCDDGDLRFIIVETGLQTECTTADHQSFFKKKTEEARKRRKAEQDRADKVRYEELKNKFDANRE